jgi:hypothetical protein
MDIIMTDCVCDGRRKKGKNVKSLSRECFWREKKKEKGTGISDDRKNIANSNKDKTVDFEGFSDECDCHGQMGKQQSALGWKGLEEIVGRE